MATRTGWPRPEICILASRNRTNCLRPNKMSTGASRASTCCSHFRIWLRRQLLRDAGTARIWPLASHSCALAGSPSLSARAARRTRLSLYALRFSCTSRAMGAARSSALTSYCKSALKLYCWASSRWICTSRGFWCRLRTASVSAARWPGTNIGSVSFTGPKKAVFSISVSYAGPENAALLPTTERSLVCLKLGFKASRKEGP
mmetsp:Transcript_22931/g.45339  ORF Transcript_22931/g.45339 Transcript_22931/m.45339 type:complete len:203 (-) Transcript_22931:171-779(-)